MVESSSLFGLLVQFAREYRFFMLAPFFLVRLVTLTPDSIEAHTWFATAPSGAGPGPVPSVSERVIAAQRTELWPLVRQWWLVALLCYEIGALRYGVALSSSYAFAIGVTALTIGVGALLIVNEAAAIIMTWYVSTFPRDAAAGASDHHHSASDRPSRSESSSNEPSVLVQCWRGLSSCCASGSKAKPRYATSDPEMDSDVTNEQL